MKEFVTESMLPILELLGSAIGAAVLSVAGIAIENAAIQTLLGGQLGVGAWEVVVGALALFAGAYVFGYERVYLRLRGEQPR